MSKIVEFIKKYRIRLTWIGLTLLAGGVGALLAGGFDAYKTVQKPPLSPPAILFPIVWTLLYILMGLAAGVIAESRDLYKGNALKLYLVQLLINILWPLLFFKLEAAKVALFWLVLLVVAVIATIRLFRMINNRAGLILLPYLAWCMFATYLNFGIVVLNS
ncbi:MAG: tryptophan-rich sensory protein [Clostridia bacterium]|nr:tryptophan-rich sensory protein [Clostridia bacterium]